MAPGADLSVQSPPARIPKLKYRNPLPAGQTLPSLDDRRCTNNLPCDADSPPLTPASIALSSHGRPSLDTASSTSASLASTASSVASSDDSRSSKKKKKAGSVFGFLSLKEPSQVAFEQYAEAQRKLALEKGSSSPSTSTSSSTNYASKKLPGNIPKVNSKWDGVPDSIKNRHAKASPLTKNRHSVMSQDSNMSHSTVLPRNVSRASVMTDGTRNPPNSVASPAASVSGLSIDQDFRSTSPTPSTNDLSETSFYFPEPTDCDASVTQPLQPQTYHPSTIESPPRSAQPSFDFSSPSDQVPGLRPDSPASSTSSADTVVRDTADVIFKKLNDQPQKSFWEDAHAVQPHDEVNIAVPESHDFLFDDLLPSDTPQSNSPMTTPPLSHYAPARPVHNFSRPISLGDLSAPPRSKRTVSYRRTPISSGLPTLYEASVTSLHSDEKVQDDAHAETRSIAPSTVAPSIMSAHWHDSPRERLGLGGRIRMDAATPWEGSGDSPSKLKRYRLSMFGKVTPRA
jgi:hypothetical protein